MKLLLISSLTLTSYMKKRFRENKPFDNLIENMLSSYSIFFSLVKNSWRQQRPEWITEMQQDFFLLWSSSYQLFYSLSSYLWSSYLCWEAKCADRLQPLWQVPLLKKKLPQVWMEVYIAPEQWMNFWILHFLLQITVSLKRY